MVAIVARAKVEDVVDAVDTEKAVKAEIATEMATE